MTILMSKELRGKIDLVEEEKEEPSEVFSSIFLSFQSENNKVEGKLEHFEENGKELTCRAIFRNTDISTLFKIKNTINCISLKGNEFKESFILDKYDIIRSGICSEDLFEDMYVFYIVIKRN